MAMLSDYQTCERIFEENGPFFHIFTTPPEKELLFINNEHYKEAMNILALAVTEAKAKELAYAIMSNHIHNIIAANKEQCIDCVDNLRKRLSGFVRRSGKKLPPIEINLVEIINLKQLRDEIAYVIRNPYASRVDVNPFSYQWCSGFLYFNDLLALLPSGTPARETSIVTRRTIKHERSQDMIPSLRIWENMIVPSSFVDYRLVMSFFDNARQFVWWTTRNVEAYIATAARLGEKGILTDEESYTVALTCTKNEFGVDSPKFLTVEQKKQLIRTLNYKYGLNNKQLSRCTSIPLPFINEMFPPILHP
jgi:hypothetical protein